MKQSPDDKIQIANLKSQKPAIVILRQLTVTLTEIIFLLLTSSFLLVSSCTDPTNPPDNGPDTTSHNFSWQMYNFGGQTGSSVLRDVAIIDENNIWAVGEIYTEDDKYNSVHWDGEQWNLKKILYNGGFWDIKTIFAFDQNNIWFEAFMRWDGKHFNELDIPEIMTGFGVTKLWGMSSTDIYVVGEAGQIRHFDGQNWQKIESGTDLPIQDIWGAENQMTGLQEILCIASDKYHNKGSKLLKIVGTQVVELNNEGLPWSISGIWFIPNTKYYVAGDGLYPSNNLNHVWQRDTSFHPIYKDAIRGQSINDIVVSGSNGLFSHYNGKSWKHFLYNELPFIRGRYYSTDIKDNTTVAVGYNEHRAIIVHGKR